MKISNILPWIPIYAPIMFAKAIVEDGEKIRDFTEHEFLNGFYHGWYGGLFILLLAMIYFELKIIVKIIR
jgi:hypothetical protein